MTRNKFNTKDPQILEAAVCNLVAMLTWQPEFVHPWSRLITAVVQQGTTVLILIVSNSSITISGFITPISLCPAIPIKIRRELLAPPAARLPPAYLSDCNGARHRLHPAAPLHLPSLCAVKYLQASCV